MPQAQADVRSIRSSTAFAHQEVKVVDPESGVLLSVGAQGEVCFRGHHVMREYFDDAEQTQRAIDDAGWLHSGDLGVMEDDGYLRITGRLKDMIIRGGENIYCIEVESALYDHPAVMDASVVGIPHKVLGQEVGAVVQLKPGMEVSEDELRAHVRNQLAAFKVPVEIQFQAEPLPRNANGKILKPELRDRFEARG